MMQQDLPKWPDKDIGEAFTRFVNEAFEKYKGCLILKGPNGFKWGSQWYPTIELAHEAIDEALIQLGEAMGTIKWEVSVVHKDGSETLLSNECKEQYLIGRSPWELFKQQQL